MTQPQILTAEYAFGPYPAAPVASDLALEASTTEGTAQMMLNSSWQMVETFTKRHYRALTGGKLILRTEDPVLYRLPLWPYPQTVTRDIHAGGGWLSETPGYLPETGEVRLGAYGTFRVIFDAIPAPALKPNVVQAVHNLALYLLIHDPARREFRSQSAGDSSFTREGMMGALYGSGAGALLAGEVRL